MAVKTFSSRCLCRIVRCFWPDTISNIDYLRQTHQPRMTKTSYEGSLDGLATRYGQRILSLKLLYHTTYRELTDVVSLKQLGGHPP